LSIDYQDHKTFHYSNFDASKAKKPKMLEVICFLFMAVAVYTIHPNYFIILGYYDHSF